MANTTRHRNHLSPTRCPIRTRSSNRIGNIRNARNTRIHHSLRFCCGHNPNSSSRVPRYTGFLCPQRHLVLSYSRSLSRHSPQSLAITTNIGQCCTFDSLIIKRETQRISSDPVAVKGFSTPCKREQHRTVPANRQRAQGFPCITPLRRASESGMAS